ncbi:major facilitator transporter [Neisseria elongata subsp. glycolytica ATCC 29315]|uniref:Major facilitator transporter n=1 Tax=Neisseria elongata subsp. glycolytica ATCC 29315 TaxID=546263 RepID=D4DNB2_NEIEG|nr:MFS transporter [Neisseria elongata]AJE17451.1 major facilitator transporter [Neisseria elongata subsp. glycolytica ATCC 29315]EFE50669.1 transporter, major facilitator family protein [Neisseria elongata subsp. glycolytica ATCC 29315]SQH49304.1 putative transporter [Neisseria elongata subsp. glycolytica]
MHTHPSIRINPWPVIAAAAFILLITIGMRMSLGLFLRPVVNTTDLSVAQFSLVIAVFQLMWGVTQPATGALADHYGAWKVLGGGALVLAAACFLIPQLPTFWGLMFAVGLLLAFGTGAGGFSIIMGQVAAKLPPAVRGLASGAVNAGGSAGQFLFAPMVQGLMVQPHIGWQGTFYVWGGLSLLILPIAWWLTRGGNMPQQAQTAQTHDGGLKQAVIRAFADRSYLLLHLGFFTCGFHIAFLVTHLPNEISLCGLPPTVASTSLAVIGLANIAGCLFSGWCVGRFPSKYVLFYLYASRVLMVAAYLAAPKTDMNFYIFAAGLGFTWLATVAPTATLTGKLFGTRYLATLFGLTMLSHQIGGFLGSYLGGQVVSMFNSYGWMWYADMLLAGAAALLNLPIKEPKPAEHA